MVIEKLVLDAMAFFLLCGIIGEAIVYAGKSHSKKEGG